MGLREGDRNIILGSFAPASSSVRFEILIGTNKFQVFLVGI